MFGTSSYKKKLIIINVANIITTNTESQNRKWEKKKKRVWEKHFLCALTSSLDELELELPSWPHLRATT